MHALFSKEDWCLEIILYLLDSNFHYQYHQVCTMLIKIMLINQRQRSNITLKQQLKRSMGILPWSINKLSQLEKSHQVSSKIFLRLVNTILQLGAVLIRVYQESKLILIRTPISQMRSANVMLYLITLNAMSQWILLGWLLSKKLLSIVGVTSTEKLKSWENNMGKE